MESHGRKGHIITRFNAAKTEEEYLLSYQSNYSLNTILINWCILLQALNI